MATRIGVDVGGTFTDLIFYDDASGEVLLAKEPTTPHAPEDGVAAAIGAAVPPALAATAALFLHGTTVGLNALLERKGAKVGLLATRGFRDVLDVRRGDRDDPYDLFWRQPEALVPRHLRLPVSERIRADGTVHLRLEEADVAAAVEAFRAEGVEAVAIAFVNSYANPQHELAAAASLRAYGFEGEISISHQVSGEYREYERTTTTIIDAYVRPRMAQYLKRLEQRLAQSGFQGRKLVTRCGGGSMTFTEAEARPFETVLSGPVAGAVGAAELAAALALDDVIAADVGGTSFDTCMITGGRPQVMYQGSVVGLPVQTEWVDVRSIGSGGGSIAHVDVGGLLRVGPRSAGADPGPASYGRGGTEPTVTDAAFVLGMLGPGSLAGGIGLRDDLARAALEPLAETLAFTIEEVARGIITIATSNMANAIREITVEQGRDPREAALMPFGGAGPLFATLLARELDIRSVVVPPYAGNFSAWGLLGADLTRSAARTRIMRVDAASLEEADRVLDGLFAELAVRAEGGSDPAGEQEIALDMRYLGQEHTITVGLGCADGRISDDAARIRELFEREYGRTFGHSMEEEIEIVSIRATIRTPLPRRAAQVVTASAAGEPLAPSRAFSFTRGEWLEYPVVRRSEIGQAGLPGPAIILEETATTYLDVGYSARPRAAGALHVTDDAAEDR
jgi:N-methylhydantoinase A